MASETVILDQRGNPYQGSVDQIFGQTITDARTSNFVLSALNAEVLMDLNGKSSLLVDVRSAAANLTFVVEGMSDGTNYDDLHGVDVETETMVVAVTVTTTIAKRYNYNVSAYRRVRVRVSAYTSGGITVSGRAADAVYHTYARLVPSTLHVTATAAANTAATATLPAAGQGLYHYITTTNLPGNPIWTVGNAMAAGDTKIDLHYAPTTPLKSTTANTATTIVMPAAGAAVVE